MGPAAASPLGAEATDVADDEAGRPALSIAEDAAGAPVALALEGAGSLDAPGVLGAGGASATVGAGGAGGGATADGGGAGCVKGSLGSGRWEESRGAGFGTGFLTRGSAGGASDMGVTSSARSTGGFRSSARIQCSAASTPAMSPAWRRQDAPTPMARQRASPLSISTGRLRKRRGRLPDRSTGRARRR